MSKLVPRNEGVEPALPELRAGPTRSTSLTVNDSGVLATTLLVPGKDNP